MAQCPGGSRRRSIGSLPASFRGNRSCRYDAASQPRGATMRRGEFIMSLGGAVVLLPLSAPGQQETSRMGIMSLIRWLFGADAATPSDAMKLDGTTEATLAHSLLASPPDEGD